MERSTNLEESNPEKEPSENSDFVAEGGTSAKAVEEVGEGTSAQVVEEVGEDAILGDDEEDGNSIDSSDDNESVVDSSDDEKGKKKVKRPQFNEERDMRNPKLVGGTYFLMVDNTTTFQIKTITGEHVCARKYQNRWASAEWLAKKYLDKLIDDPDWKVTVMQSDVKRARMLDVLESHIYRAKRKAELIVEGDYGEQYFRLWDYCDMIVRENPGSCAKLLVDRPLVDDVSYFQRIFIMFDIQAKGFVGNCRPIIHLDACFLKGPSGGQFIHAVGRDGNNQMYPLAMVVMESELKSSWTWFLDILTDAIGKPKEKGWVFMSDRQKASVVTYNLLSFILSTLKCKNEYIKWASRSLALHL
ncbi:hypothetical protein Vadar_027697 [Vaccinium darrowii]|uniref:Uncharacterized protein n=1 Tax=Vaccinium darrowii TaxID=229202 RepID=A0ACB7Z6W8_9ERIC|nr:hypothetical protein Vadar_027697 [Vaccinium darrowii]